MESSEEKNRKRKAWMTNGAIQLLILLVFYFLAAYRAPDPPNPEFGVELNFGNVDTGSGQEKVTSPTQNPDPQDEEQSSESADDAPVETDNTSDTQEVSDPVENPNADVSQQEASSSSQSNPTETNQQNTYTGNPNSADTSHDTNSSQGETGDAGDQGNPQGDINEDALYGNPGGGEDGSSLKMSGWEWDSPPEPKDTSDEAGKIVFEITVDSDGYLIGKKVLTSTVSPQVVKQYELAIEQLTFSKTSTYKPAASSKGIITFIIRSR